MAEIIMIDDARRRSVAKWLHNHLCDQVVADYADIKLGRRDLHFVVEANRRAIDLMVLLYDICANDDERKTIRDSFRQIMRRHSGRLAPYYDELHAPMRTRLREHKMYVRCGLDAPDEPRRRANA